MWYVKSKDMFNIEIYIIVGGKNESRNPLQFGRTSIHTDSV